MTTRPPLARLHAAALLAGIVLMPARAETGNAMNPGGINPASAGRWLDEEGMGTRAPSARTPSGKLYDLPVANEEDETKKGDGWKSRGFIEAGGLHLFKDSRAAGFLQYKDLRSGAYVDSFGVTGENQDEARFFEATGGAPGLDDQFYRLVFGRHNDWKVTTTYDSTPQTFNTSYRSLWSGIGTANLAIAGLPAGGSPTAAATQANVQAVIAATPMTELEVIRKKAGVRFDMRLSDTWRIYASFSEEKREGARPFGAVFGGGGGGGNMELTESIDYSTHDFAAGAQFSDATSSFNLRASASFFRNDIDTLSFQNPLSVTLNGTSGLAPASFTQGRFDLVPNNEHFNVKGEYARVLPDLWRGNFTAGLALGTMRQDDNLIAPTAFDLAGGTVTAGGAPLTNLWNTPAALSRRTADARIDTLLADAGLSLKPLQGLDLKGKVRYYETRNAMQYQACNPLTGQWGRLINDGSGLSLVTVNTTPGANPSGTSANAYNAAACDLAAVRALGLSPATGNVPIASVPADYRQFNASIAADHRLGRARSFNVSLEQETWRRDFRERDETNEYKAKVAYVDRGLIEGSIRVSYEHDRRGGGAYDSNPYLPFLSASFGPVPLANTASVASWFHTIGQFRSFDLADRNQNILNGRVDYIVRQDVDAAMTLQVKDASYPSEYGRTGRQRSASATFDVTYQAGSNAVLYGYYAYQAAAMQQKGVQPNSCIIGSTYYFYSDGRVLNAATGAAAPAVPAGTTLVATQNVVPGNWSEVCGFASPTSPLFPQSRDWDVASKDRNDVLGFGAKFDLGKVKLDTTFTRTLGRTRINYSYNAAALGLSALQAALAGSGPSDLAFAQNTFNASALVPVSRDLLVRFLVRHETGRIRDWHYDGVAANPMPVNNAAYLDGGPRDFRTTLVGVMFHLRM